MIQVLPKTVSFDEFITWYPEKTEIRYELHNGIIYEVPKPTGKHGNVTGFLMEELILTMIQMGKRGIWRIPRESIIKSMNEKSGYEPDIIVLDQENIDSETRWNTESVIQKASSIKLVVEVVSTNWRDDYHLKYADYEEMGIPEYWIVDYAALGGRNFIGSPKQQTLFVCQMIEGEYQMNHFRGSDLIVSPTFNQLNLTAQQVFTSRMT